MPPSDPPATGGQPRDAELVEEARAARTMSATVMTGKSDP